MTLGQLGWWASIVFVVIVVVVLYLLVRKDMREGDQRRPISERRREPIPERVRHAVWRRDQGRCVECGSQERLEYDHIIPLSEGGANTERNFQLLCASCNREKGASL